MLEGMSSMTVRGAGRAQWPEVVQRASRKSAVERVDPVEKAVDDGRSLGASATELVPQDFEAAGVPARTSPTPSAGYVRDAIAAYARNSRLT
jgi:hypothetical protein